jgi:hypothetical protein
MNINVTNKVGVLDTRTVFDLPKMKRLFGEPVLLGGEKMRDFDDHANTIITDFEVGNAILAALVYNFILESFKRMRLMRHQSRAMQARILQDRSGTSSTNRKDRETEVTTAMAAKIDLFAKFDYLISEATKREAILLQQIAMQSAFLADKLSRQTAQEQTRIEFAERKNRLRRQKAIDNFYKRTEQEQAAKAAVEKKEDGA